MSPDQKVTGHQKAKGHQNAKGHQKVKGHQKATGQHSVKFKISNDYLQILFLITEKYDALILESFK